MPNDLPAEPWNSFLSSLNDLLDAPVDLHCIGGFVVSQHYGLGRETADLDVVNVVPVQSAGYLVEVAGKGSALHKKHRVYLDFVGVASYPADYEERLIRVFPFWSHLHLWALEAHDLALTKLERSGDRDIRDIIFLAKAGLIDRATLEERFKTEWEPYVSGRSPTWHRTTLQMWFDACWPG